MVELSGCLIIQLTNNFDDIWSADSTFLHLKEMWRTIPEKSMPPSGRMTNIRPVVTHSKLCISLDDLSIRFLKFWSLAGELG